MQIAKINGINIHYSDSALKNAPIIVFLNSLGTDFRIWDGLAHYLKKKFRVICYDKRGHGLSDIGETPYSIEILANDLSALLDQLKVDNAIICGVSVGGMIAQQLAISHPEKVTGLVLCNTGSRIGTSELWRERISDVENQEIEVISSAITGNWFSTDFKSSRENEIEGWRNMLIRANKAGYIATCHTLMTTDLTDAAYKITAPVLCIAGNEDVVTPPKLVQEMATHMSDATFKMIEGVGHLPCIEKPEILAYHITEFLKENDLN